MIISFTICHLSCYQLKASQGRFPEKELLFFWILSTYQESSGYCLPRPGISLLEVSVRGMYVIEKVSECMVLYCVWIWLWRCEQKDLCFGATHRSMCRDRAMWEVFGGPSLGLNASNCLEQKWCFSFKAVSIVYFGGLKKPVRVVWASTV